MSKKYEEFTKYLYEMFQLEQSDELDFGIYKILKVRANEIKTFLEQDLLTQVKSILSNYVGAGDNITKKRITELEETLGIDTLNDLPESNVKKAEYLKLKDKLAHEVSLEDAETEVYSALLNFFRRYYDNGDFVSKRRYKEGVYAIPYEGEEVKLYWANQDQYYIKTSEQFKDYTYTHDNKTIHFKLVEANTDKDNNKESKEKERKFIICKDEFLSIEDGELIVRFEYRSDPRKQADLVAEAVQRVIEAVKPTSEYKDFSYALFAPKPTDKNPSRSIFEKHLAEYTAKNTFDYFIHKNLGKFLKLELDFFIKNEVFHIEDIDPEAIEKHLGKAKAIKEVGEKIIEFLAQIENFQKKLWLKKKFVIETNYCITLDKIDETFYAQIISCEKQHDEWVRLFAIDQIKGDSDKVAYSKPLTIEFLKQNPYLVLDTVFFSSDFKEQLIDSINNLNEAIDGQLVHSENFQAINLLQEQLKEKVKCVYIDPPYNTSASEILYKNSYKHSSWLSMISNRVSAAWNLLRSDGVLEIAIDDAEFYRLQGLMNQIFGDDNHVANIAIMHNPKGREQSFVSDAHEYTLLYAKDKNKLQLNRLKLSADEIKEKYPKEDKNGRYRELPLRRRGTAPFREDRPYMYFPFVYNPNDGSISVIDRDNYAKIYNGKSFDDDFVVRLTEEYEKKKLELIFPIREDGSLGRWRWGYDRCLEECDKGIFFVTGKVPTIYHKDYVNDTMLPKSIWFSERFDASTKGTNILKDILPRNEFDYPKSIFAVEDFIQIGSSKNDLVLDFFAGSGTTAHAVINLNREYKENRKYILVEMGNYFHTVTKPRVQKVIYSKEWKGGKPVKRDGVSQIIKYIRLESYEDALSNIVVKEREKKQIDMLEKYDFLREQYTLKYMLDNETAGSQSLLNIDSFANPFEYKLKVFNGTETIITHIDIVETFNYLLGLETKKIYKKDSFTVKTSEEPEYEGAVDLTHDKAGEYSFKAVEGILRTGQNVLVIWRTLTGDLALDNAALDTYFRKKKINSFNMEYDLIYVNGDNNLQNIKIDDEHWKVVMIEEEFKKLMFDGING